MPQGDTGWHADQSDHTDDTLHGTTTPPDVDADTLTLLLRLSDAEGGGVADAEAGGGSVLLSDGDAAEEVEEVIVTLTLAVTDAL